MTVTPLWDGCVCDGKSTLYQDKSACEGVQAFVLGGCPAVRDSSTDLNG